MKPYQTLLIQNGTSWQDAVQHYLSFFNQDLKRFINLDSDHLDDLGINSDEPIILSSIETDDDYETAFYRDNYRALTPVSESNFINLQNEIKLEIPQELKALYLEHGPFIIDGDDIVHSFRIITPNLNNALFFIKNDFIEGNALTEEQYCSFESRFIIIGLSCFDDEHNRKMLLFYDVENKKYGEIALLPDECDVMKNQIFPQLFSGALSSWGIDEIICNQLNRILFLKLFDANYGLLSQNEIVEDYYSKLITECPVILGY